MLDIDATPTVLLYCWGQLVDEFTCAGDSGPRVMLKHVKEQVGSIPDPWHRIRSGTSPELLTPGTTSCVPATDYSWNPSQGGTSVSATEDNASFQMETWATGVDRVQEG
ncbi:unnamed protein product [Ectocarpus sp. 8 AP-2014]